MSVTDSLIVELKQHASQLLRESSLSKPIPDGKNVQNLCECLERVFLKGLNIQGRSFTSLMTLRCPADDCWHWIRALGQRRVSWCDGSSVPYSYSSSVEKTERNSRLTTSCGRLRYLIRAALVRRCIHVPVRLLRNEPNWQEVYTKYSILGDDILLELALSVLMSLSKLEFCLNLENCLFLDETWDLPEFLALELVPSRILGVTVVFIQSKALVINVKENSVAEECVHNVLTGSFPKIASGFFSQGHIMVGDVLVSVNGMEIDEGTQGSMMNVMRKTSGRPLEISIVKSVMTNKTLFPPMTRLLKQAGISVTAVVEQYNAQDQDNINQSESSTSIFYVGQVGTGDKGDVKQIFLAINQLVDRYDTKGLKMEPVTVECHDLGVRVISELEESKGIVLLEHPYMEISSCGSSKSGPLYFAYIAGFQENDVDVGGIQTRITRESRPSTNCYTNHNDGSFATCKNFQCYVFYSNNRPQVESLLKTIGQGFKRTLFTV